MCSLEICFNHLKASRGICASLYFYMNLQSSMEDLFYNNEDTNISLEKEKVSLLYKNKLQIIAEDLQNFTAIFHMDNILPDDFNFLLEVANAEEFPWLNDFELQPSQNKFKLDLELISFYEYLVSKGISSPEASMCIEKCYKYSWPPYYTIEIYTKDNCLIFRCSRTEVITGERIDENLQPLSKNNSQLNSVYIGNFMEISFHENSFLNVLRNMLKKTDMTQRYIIAVLIITVWIWLLSGIYPLLFLILLRHMKFSR